MTSSRPTSSARGFTLIEILLAVVIMSIVIGAITASLIVGTRAVAIGRESLEVYQTTRAGMNRIVRDLRKSLSHLSTPYTEEVPEEFDEYGNPMMDPYMEDRTELQASFRGTANEVEFTIRQESKDENGPSMDLREVRFRVGEDNTVVKEAFRSLLQARLEDTVARRLRTQFGPEVFLPFDSEGGYYDELKPIVICDGVKELEFSYFDGVEWTDSWDSTEWILSDHAYDLPEEELLPEDSELTGLPVLVQVSMLLTNNTVLETVTKIPGSNLNSLPLRTEAESLGHALIVAADRERALRDEGLIGRGGYQTSGGVRGNRVGRNRPREVAEYIPPAPYSGGGGGGTPNVTGGGQPRQPSRPTRGGGGRTGGGGGRPGNETAFR